MKKATKVLLGIFTFSILISSMALAQSVTNMYYSGEFNSFGAEAMSFISGPNHWKVTIQAPGDDSESNFLFRDSNSNFNNKWSRGDAVSFGTEEDAFWQGGDTRFNATNTKYYTFILSNVSTSSNGKLTVQETTNSPIDISSTTIDSVTSDTLYLKVTVSASLSAEEKIYIRYTNDNFSTSKHVKATGSSTTYLAKIPFTDDVIYYSLSTTVDLGADNTTYSGDYDLVTLDLENNGGSNYSYNYGFEVSITGDAGWRLLSLPKTGGTVADISDDSPVQGVTDGDDAGSDANFIIYDNTGSYEQPTNVSTAWGDGYGFGLYFYNNTTNGSATLPVTLDASGAEPSSDVTINLNKSTTSGGLNHYFTLVGNPYAANYNLNSITQSGTGLQDNVHFWDDGAGSYDPEDRTASSGFIASPWQGFWAEVSNAGTSTTITFPTSGKSTSDTTKTFFSKEISNRGDIAFTLSGEESFDKAIRLSFRDYATEQIDPADATKMIPLLPSYATMAFESNDILKSVESLPYNLEEEVTLALQPQLVGVSGEFTFGWNGLETIPGEWELILHDYDTGENIDMRAASEYVFTAGAQAKANPNPLSLLSGPAAVAMKAKAEANRFGITIRPTSVSNETEDTPAAFALEQNYPNPFNPSTTISYSVQEAGAVTISVYNLMGQKVATLVDETKAAGQYNVRWNAAGAASGMYYYRLEAGGQSITRKMTLIK